MALDPQEFDRRFPPGHPRNRFQEVDLQSTVVATVQSKLDNFAQQRGYDSILSACTYVASTVPKFAAEAQTCINLRDSVWATLYAILADVTAGTRPVPTVDQILAELPAFVW